MTFALLLACGCAAPTHPPPPGDAAPASAAPATTGAAIAPAAPPPTASGASDVAPLRTDERFDVAIRGGEVVDGTGAPRRRADVLVRGDRIAFVGPVDPAVRAAVEIDASGAVVTPGFVDAHSHGGGTDDNAIAQGVTTVVIGQDGASPTSGRLRPWMASLEGRLRTNVATMVGHASVRRAAKASVPASARDREAMARLVDEALADGAFGLSTALEYEPGRRADAAELTAVAIPVGKRGGLVMSHLRSEDEGAIGAAIDELVAQGRSAGARVHVAHLKVVMGHGEAGAIPVLERLDAARRGGVEITADWYPYTASSTGLSILFPGGAPDRAALLRHLRDRVMSRNGPEATMFGPSMGPDLRGKTLAAVARERNVPFEVVLADLGARGGDAVYFVMDEPLQDRLFADPNVMVGSDGSGASSHPRGSGAFARILQTYVEEKRALPLEEAVRRMTSLPLHTLRADADRGRVRAGDVADLAVFTPREILERATYLTPGLQARGMRHVLVAGRLAWRDGSPVAGAPGRVLRAPWAEAGAP